MGNIKLYKYLDVNGGLMMLHNSNLQFTNATRLNDPFDCHPALFDFSHAPECPFNWIAEARKCIPAIKVQTNHDNENNVKKSKTKRYLTP